MRPQSFLTVVVASLQLAVPLAASAQIGVGLPPAPNFNQQLNIKPNSGTRGADRNDADKLVILGGQREAQGDLMGAIAAWEQARQIYWNINDMAAMGTVYDYIGLAYAQMGKFVEAEDALRRRLAVARDNGDFRGQIYGLNNMGTILLRRGGIEGAEETLEEALTIARNVKSIEGEGLTLSNLGLTIASSGNYARAIAYYEAAIRFRRQGEDLAGQTNTLNHLGRAYQMTRNYQAAIGVYGDALRLARSLEDIPNRYRAIDGLVAVYRATRNYGRANDLLLERLSVAQGQRNPRQVLETLLATAQLYEASGNLPQTINYYRQALELSRTIGDTEAASTLLYELNRLNNQATVQ